MSHLHFPAALPYKKKILQMGEPLKNIFCFGAPGLDNAYKLRLMSRVELADELGIPADATIGAVVFHPVTLETSAADAQMDNLLEAMGSFPEVCWILTLPNADTGRDSIARKVKAFVSLHPQNSRLFASLGRKKYLSLLKHCAVLVGNSSSALIEAPAFELPVVNIGDRQRGRIRARNVIDVETCTRTAIKYAMDRALSSEFRDSLKGMKNPYGHGDVSRKIVKKLKNVKLDMGLIKKKFCEITQ
jgi:UDP-hydrolysing UDP-N-acetyl-D-glucosamine 2-epimerase